MVEIAPFKETNLEKIIDCSRGKHISVVIRYLDKKDLEISSNLFRRGADMNLYYRINSKNGASKNLAFNETYDFVSDGLIKSAIAAAGNLCDNGIISNNKHIRAAGLLIETVIHLNELSKDGSEYAICCRDDKYFFIKSPN